jgi:glycosyltransferase involved in cell wall biosynthesis
MISVIIPIYNSEKTLARCLDSILSQSYNDFELILVNDGSIDNSAGICMDYVNRNPEKTHYYYKTNGGVSSARNMGIEKAQGEYICFVDSDDYVESTYLEVLYRGITEYGTVFSMCDISRNSKGNDGETIILNNCDDIISVIMSSQYGTLNRGPYCKIFLKKILQDEFSFAEDIYLGEDTLFCVEYAKRCKNGVYIRKGLYHYDTPTSSTAYRTDTRMLRKYLTYIDSRQKMLEDVTMLNRNSYVLITNSLFESIQESYFVAKRANRKDVQQDLRRLMYEMRNKYSLKYSEQDKPFSWYVMAHWPEQFDNWMYIYGKYHGLLLRLGLQR